MSAITFEKRWDRVRTASKTWGEEERRQIQPLLDKVRPWDAVVPPDAVEEARQALCRPLEELRASAKAALSRGDMRTLELDVPRTLQAFEEDYPGANSPSRQVRLHRVLLVVSPRSGCGYSQGLNLLAGAVLLGASGSFRVRSAADEAKAVVRDAVAVCVLLRLLVERGVGALYASEVHLASKDGGAGRVAGAGAAYHLLTRLLGSLLASHEWETACRLRSRGFHADMFATRWLLTCLCGAARLDVALTALDAVLAESPNALLRVCVGLAGCVGERTRDLGGDELMVAWKAASKRPLADEMWRRAVGVPTSVLPGAGLADKDVLVVLRRGELPAAVVDAVVGEATPAGGEASWGKWTRPMEDPGPRAGGSDGAARGPAALATLSEVARDDPKGWAAGIVERFAPLRAVVSTTGYSVRDGVAFFHVATRVPVAGVEETSVHRFSEFVELMEGLASATPEGLTQTLRKCHLEQTRRALVRSGDRPKREPKLESQDSLAGLDWEDDLRERLRGVSVASLFRPVPVPDPWDKSKWTAPSVPPKTVFRSVQPEFLSQRSDALGNALTSLVAIPHILFHPVVMNFLGIDRPQALDAVARAAWAAGQWDMGGSELVSGAPGARDAQIPKAVGSRAQSARDLLKSVAVHRKRAAVRSKPHRRERVARADGSLLESVPLGSPEARIVTMDDPEARAQRGGDPVLRRWADETDDDEEEEPHNQTNPPTSSPEKSTPSPKKSTKPSPPTIETAQDRLVSSFGSPSNAAVGSGVVVSIAPPSHDISGGPAGPPPPHLRPASTPSPLAVLGALFAAVDPRRPKASDAPDSDRHDQDEDEDDIWEAHRQEISRDFMDTKTNNLYLEFKLPKTKKTAKKATRRRKK